MKIVNKRNLLGLAVFLCSGVIFADCPMVGNHTLSAHTANNSKCTYVANAANFAALHNAKLCTKAFILTDPHYKFSSCKISSDTNKCVCTIVRT